MTPSRRQFLGTTLVASTLALAGCVSGDDSSNTDDADPERNVDDWQRIDGEILSSSFPMELYETGTENRLAEVHWHSDWAHWHKMPVAVPYQQWRSYEIRVLDQDLDQIALGEEEPHHVEVRRTEETPADLVDISVSGQFLDMRGETEGSGELVFQIIANGEAVWTSPPLLIEVTSESQN